MLPEFQWLPLNWDAVAVFATGFSAVAGAVFVGLQQSKITKLQIQIQRDQIEADKHLRLNDLRLRLLDQRSECIKDMKEVLSAFHSNSELSADERVKLFEAIQKAELIFEGELLEGLKDIAWNSVRIPNKFRLQASLARRGKADEAEKAMDEGFAMLDEIYDELPQLINSMVKHSRISHFD